MKRNATYLVLMMVLMAKLSYANSFSFRVQCTKNGDKDLLSVFNKIPERQSFMLPSGATMYFSGTYFTEYSDAKNRLEVVKELGIKGAFIRVFRNRTFLQERTSDRILKKFELDYAKRVAKLDSLKKAEEELLAKYYKEQAEKSDVSVVKNGFEKKAVNKKKEEVVNVAPTYRILIGQAKAGEMMSDDLDRLNEVVYENKKGNNVYFSIGSYSSIKEAKDELFKYKYDAKNSSFKIVGLYKGTMISEEMANELMVKYQLQKKRK